MLVFAVFTVDFGSWYDVLRGAQARADAAALAGVVWMPEFDQAQQYALATAAKNGFVNGQNNIVVTVTQIPNNDRQLQATITDTKAKQFFSLPRDEEPEHLAEFDRRVHHAGATRGRRTRSVRGTCSRGATRRTSGRP